MSLISTAINALSQEHRLDAGVDHCKVEGPCELKSGHEVTFVSLVADYVYERLNSRTDWNLGYHQWVYMPSRPAERRVGYDLSLGYYEDRKRVRTMHKLLMDTWCDRRRSWKLPMNGGDREHFVRLLMDQHRLPALRPYIVLHLCYCIHDYRRMGAMFEDYQVPTVESLLRTVVISLAEFQEPYLADVPLDEVVLDYHRVNTAKQPGEDNQAYLNRIAAPDNHYAQVSIGGLAIRRLAVTSLPEWADAAVSFLL